MCDAGLKWSLDYHEKWFLSGVQASHLLKFVYFLYDWQGYRIKLHFLRDITKKETDFLITVDNKPWFSVETKSYEENISGNLKYFAGKLKIPYSYQVIRKSGVDRLKEGIRIISADKFLTGLV